jgi:hypothetical protein
MLPTVYKVVLHHSFPRMTVIQCTVLAAGIGENTLLMRSPMMGGIEASVAVYLRDQIQRLRTRELNAPALQMRLQNSRAVLDLLRVLLFQLITPEISGLARNWPQRSACENARP